MESYPTHGAGRGWYRDGVCLNGEPEERGGAGQGCALYCDHGINTEREREREAERRIGAGKGYKGRETEKVGGGLNDGAGWWGKGG